MKANTSTKFQDIFSTRKYHKEREKSKIKYSPTISKSPEHPVCERYLDFLVGYWSSGIVVFISTSRWRGVHQDFTHNMEVQKSSEK